MASAISDARAASVAPAPAYPTIVKKRADDHSQNTEFALIRTDGQRHRLADVSALCRGNLLRRAQRPEVLAEVEIEQFEQSLTFLGVERSPLAKAILNCDGKADDRTGGKVCRPALGRSLEIRALRGRRAAQSRSGTGCARAVRRGYYGSDRIPRDRVALAARPTDEPRQSPAASGTRTRNSADSMRLAALGVGATTRSSPRADLLPEPQQAGCTLGSRARDSAAE